jgi:hypothetical protein
MNSGRNGSIASGVPDNLSYTEDTMTHDSTSVRLTRCQQGNSLGQSRVAMAEVKICGIPKLCSPEVAPT